MNYQTLRHLADALEDSNSTRVTMALLDAVEALVVSARDEQERREKVRDIRHEIYMEQGRL